MPRLRVKVCCISTTQEAAMAQAAGADLLGFVGAMPSGPGIITDQEAQSMIQTLPPGIASVTLTSAMTADAIIDQLTISQASTLQVVQHIDPNEYQQILEQKPNIKRIQVIHVEGDDALSLIERYEPWIDAFLLDSGRPSIDPADHVLELGGTGRVHDWSVSAAFVKATAKPVFLAGGLTPENVREGIEKVRPFGVDLCSGVRTNDRLDQQKLTAFMAAVAGQ